MYSVQVRKLSLLLGHDFHNLVITDHYSNTDFLFGLSDLVKSYSV